MNLTEIPTDVEDVTEIVTETEDIKTCEYCGDVCEKSVVDRCGDTLDFCEECLEEYFASGGGYVNRAVRW